MDFLTEVDKLVQLIECPIFTCKGLASGLWTAWREAGVKPHSERREEGRERAVTPGILRNVKNVRLGRTVRAEETRWSRAGTRGVGMSVLPQGGFCRHTSADSKTHLKVNATPAREN